jgi:hypothetical protein
VWGQLVHGIRYLDLRVGYYPPTNKTDAKDHGARYVNTGVSILVVLNRQATTRCSPNTECVPTVAARVQTQVWSCGIL